MKKQLIQLHHQFKDHTDFVVQQRVGSVEEIKSLIKEMKIKHPLPKEAHWMLCAEDSEYFVKGEVTSYQGLSDYYHEKMLDV